MQALYILLCVQSGKSPNLNVKRLIVVFKEVEPVNVCFRSVKYFFNISKPVFFVGTVMFSADL